MDYGGHDSNFERNLVPSPGNICVIHLQFARDSGSINATFMPGVGGGERLRRSELHQRRVSAPGCLLDIQVSEMGSLQHYLRSSTIGC